MDQFKQTDGQAVVLVCQGNYHSQKVSEFLIQQIDLENSYHLEDGLYSWEKPGNETVQNEIQFI